MKKYVVMAIAICSLSSYAMEQNPFTKADQEQDRHKIADEYAEEIRNKMDVEILHINVNNSLRNITGTYYSWRKNSSLATQQEVIEVLNEIESYMLLADDHELIIESLRKKHGFFAQLVKRAIDYEVDRLHTVTGFTVDDYLNGVIPNYSPFVGNFVKTKALEIYQWRKNGDTNALSSISFDQEYDEIHFVPLCGHSWNIDLGNNELLMSNDSKYLRAIDHKGKRVVWDMKSGKQVFTKIDRKKWTRYYEEDHHCLQQRVVDEDCQYLATTGMGLAYGTYGMHDIHNRSERSSSCPVITLFVRPTVESYLCQNAFVNSKGNQKALTELLASKTLKKMSGFPAVNLKVLIKAELEYLKK